MSLPEEHTDKVVVQVARTVGNDVGVPCVCELPRGVLM